VSSTSWLLTLTESSLSNLQLISLEKSTSFSKSVVPVQFSMYVLIFSNKAELQNG
jgi:hypothetical protein